MTQSLLDLYTRTAHHLRRGDGPRDRARRAAPDAGVPGAAAPAAAASRSPWQARRRSVAGVRSARPAYKPRIARLARRLQIARRRCDARAAATLRSIDYASRSARHPVRQHRSPAESNTPQMTCQACGDSGTRCAHGRAWHRRVLHSVAARRRIDAKSLENPGLRDRGRGSKNGGLPLAGCLTARRDDQRRDGGGDPRRGAGPPARPAHPADSRPRSASAARASTRDIAIPGFGESVKTKRRRGLHPPARHDDRRRSADRAVPRHPRDADREQEIPQASSASSRRTSSPARRSPRRCASTPRSSTTCSST